MGQVVVKAFAPVPSARQSITVIPPPSLFRGFCRGHSLIRMIDVLIQRIPTIGLLRYHSPPWLPRQVKCRQLSACSNEGAKCLGIRRWANDLVRCTRMRLESASARRARATWTHEAAFVISKKGSHPRRQGPRLGRSSWRYSIVYTVVSRLPTIRRFANSLNL